MYKTSKCIFVAWSGEFFLEISVWREEGIGHQEKEEKIPPWDDKTPKTPNGLAVAGHGDRHVKSLRLKQKRKNIYHRVMTLNRWYHEKNT